MILYIDTSGFDKVMFALAPFNSPPLRGGARGGWKIKNKTYKLAPHENFEILHKLEDFFLKSKILNPKSTIKKIVVNKGPGSFMGVRVGVAIAMALGFAWSVPVKAVAKDKFRPQIH